MRQDQATQEIAKVVADDPEQQAELVGPEPMTREEDPVPSVSTVDVARPERGGEAVAVLVEDEERMVTEIRKGELAIVSSAGIDEVSLDQRVRPRRSSNSRGSSSPASEVTAAPRNSTRS